MKKIPLHGHSIAVDRMLLETTRFMANFGFIKFERIKVAFRIDHKQNRSPLMGMKISSLCTKGINLKDALIIRAYPNKKYLEQPVDWSVFAAHLQNHMVPFIVLGRQ